MSEKINQDNQVPNDLIIVGYVAGAYGVQGWIRVRPYSDDAEALLTVREWWFDKPHMHAVRVNRARFHNDEVLVRISSLQSREEAESTKGTVVYISRRLFPELDEDEFYWVDLIGLKVVNLQGEELGVVHDLMDNGAHQILRIEVEKTGETQKSRECLIPFVDKFIDNVDLKARTISVDWEEDY